MSRFALCVGINNYPGVDLDLEGCVNDVHDWQALLEGRGYRVERLVEAEATRARMLEALRELIGRAVDGDSLVFTFSGHGSWLPDANSDEPDERDEMLCPYDVMQAEGILDDDLHTVFSAKPDGARLYVIADCCHSGSVVRFAPPPAGTNTRLKARFLPPYVFARGDRRFERAIDRAANTPAPTKLHYPAVLFAGCSDDEFSYDAPFGSRPNGAFTRTALDALADTSITTPRQLYEAVRRHLPSHDIPQTPQLFGDEAAKAGPLF